MYTYTDIHRHENGKQRDGGCGCGGGCGELLVCEPSGLVGLERTRFFPRQLIGPDELTQDQIYFRDKHRRHNRLLHGWGIVCGACVRSAGGCKVEVQPGYILGPQGDEIIIPEEVTVDLCCEDVDGNCHAPCGGVDPWCSDLRVCHDRGIVYLAVRYAECQARPVRVFSGCGCDESECEYSRTRDSYALKVLTELPAGYDRRRRPLFEGLMCRGEPPACPPCPPDPWVILADIELADCEVVDIDCFRHRRYVASFASYFYVCRSREIGGWERPGQLGGYKITKSLIDYKATADDEPRGSVVLRSSSGELTELPAYFSVRPGDTFGTLLEREGGRTFEDPETGDVFTLGDVYAAAAVDPDQSVGSTMEALAPLEGLDLRPGELDLVRRGLGELIDTNGLERLDREHAGAPGGAAELPASHLLVHGPKSRLAARLGDPTIGEVAESDPDELVARAVKGVRAARRPAFEQEVRDLHAAANRVVRLGRVYRPPDA
jgi:hypothetical protein